MDVPPWTYLLMSQRRPMGSFTTTPRIHSSLLQVGLGEPWSAALRLSMAQQLRAVLDRRKAAHRGAAGARGGGVVVGEGVSRYVAMVTLARLGLLSPDDVKEAVGGELSVLATSPYKGKGNEELAGLARDPVARATLMARGALYALRESAAIRARSKDQRSLVSVLGDLERAAEDHPDQAAISTQAWVDAVTRDDPDAAKTFDALVAKGQPIALPATALGPCFRATTGEYVAFDPGFDFEATSVATRRQGGRRAPGRPRGEGGPAERRRGRVDDRQRGRRRRAGEDGGDARGAGREAERLLHPRGVHGRGQTFTRRPSDDRRPLRRRWTEPRSLSPGR